MSIPKIGDPTPAERQRRVDGDEKRRAEERERRAELAQLKGLYAEYKKREAELSALVNSISLKSDFPAHLRHRAELDGVQDFLAAAPPEIVESYCAPQTTPERPHSYKVAQYTEVIAVRESEIKRIEFEMPELDVQLQTIPTQRERGKWTGMPDNESHYRVLNERKAGKLARIEWCRADIEKLKAEIDLIKGAE